MEGGLLVQFGILGCATIARKISRAIQLSPNATLHAIASRSIEKARRFLDANDLPVDKVKAYGSYDELLDDPKVDAVYIPLPTSLHVTWTLAAAGKKKHVLVEKPAALCVADLDVILAACEANGVQFMDGTMWLHHPRTAKMEEEVLSDASLIGEPRFIHSSSSFSATQDFLESNIRVKPDLDSLGVLGDLGWYCIGAILWAVNYRLPKLVVALPAVDVNQEGILLSCGGSLHWNDGSSATFHSSFLSSVSMDLNLHGSCGSLVVRDLAIPYKEDTASFSFVSGARFTDLHTGWTRTLEDSSVPASLPQEAIMIQEFAKLIKGAPHLGCRPGSRWPEVTRKTQLVLDAVKRSIDLCFKPVAL